MREKGRELPQNAAGKQKRGSPSYLLFKTGETQVRDAKQEPPHSDGVVPLPQAQRSERGGSGKAAQGVIYTKVNQWEYLELRPLTMSKKAF